MHVSRGVLKRIRNTVCNMHFRGKRSIMQALSICIQTPIMIILGSVCLCVRGNSKSDMKQLQEKRLYLVGK